MEKYRSILKEHGLRVTSKRLGIIRVLGGSAQPMDVKEICESLSKIGVCINVSTVYRGLESLLTAGIVERINFSGDARVFYELARPGHRHFLHCLSCGELVSLDVCPLRDYQLELTRHTGYEVVSHNLDLYGYCPSCRAGRKERA